MGAMTYAELSAMNDNRRHQNHPDNDCAAFEAQVFGEMDAILAECASVSAAVEFDSDNEPLAEHTARIVNIVCAAMENPHFSTPAERYAHIGQEVSLLVVQAAQKVALQRIEREALK